MREHTAPQRQNPSDSSIVLTPRRGDVVYTTSTAAAPFMYSGDLAGFKIIIVDRPIMIGNQGPFGAFFDLPAKRFYVERSADDAIQSAFDAGVAAGRGELAGNAVKRIRPKLNNPRDVT